MRTRTKNKHWPQRFRYGSGKYWHETKGSRKWTDLGTDEIAAIAKWAEIEARTRYATEGTVAAAIDRYVAEVLPSKSR